MDLQDLTINSSLALELEEYLALLLLADLIIPGGNELEMSVSRILKPLMQTEKLWTLMMPFQYTQPQCLYCNCRN